MLNSGKTFCPIEVSVILFTFYYHHTGILSILYLCLLCCPHNCLRKFNLFFLCLETDNIKLSEVQKCVPCSFCVSGVWNNYLHKLGGIEACIIICWLGSAWIKNKIAEGATVTETGLKLTPKCAEFQFILSVKWLSIYRQNYTCIEFRGRW